MKSNIATMWKQVIFWCSVFAVAVISGVFIGERGFYPSGPLQPVPVDRVTSRPISGL